MGRMMIERRTFLRTVGTLSVCTVVAGCAGGSNDTAGTTATTTASDTTRTTSGATSETTATTTGTATPTGTTTGGGTNVAVGPDQRLRFEPESIEIEVGETVVWTAESPGHNVTSKPGASERCENPDGAEPFASYEGSNHYAIMEVGETFQHEFTVQGEYIYVCEPHAGQGMVGSITVSE